MALGSTKELGVKYKSHPYYDNSPLEDWLSLRPDGWGELEPGTLQTLHELVRNDKQRLCELALDRILAAAGESYVAERPFPEVNEFQFYPIGDHGYRVYIEYFFNQRLGAASPDSDFWWAIINRPYAIKPFPMGPCDTYVIGLGWAVP